jgi:hypothetical protein
MLVQRQIGEGQPKEGLIKDLGVNWRERPQKHAAVIEATTRAARLLGSAAPVRSALVMPAGPWQDVKTGMETGLYSPDTRFIAIERSPKVFLDMVESSWRVGMRNRPDCRRADLCEVTDLPLGLEAAFLDVCAFIDVQTAIWMREQLVPALAPGAVVILTTPSDGMDRNNPMPKAAREFFSGPRKDIIDDFQDRLCYHRTVQAISEECALGLATAFAALAPAGLPDEPVLLRPYRDRHHSMTLLVIVTTGEPSDFPSLGELLGELPPYARRASPTPSVEEEITDPLARAMADLAQNRLQRERLTFRMAELDVEQAAIEDRMRAHVPAISGVEPSE